MTYICYHHKIIPENYFTLTIYGQLMYNGRCVDTPRSPQLELVECAAAPNTWWELKKQGVVWGSLRLHKFDDGKRKEWCIAQVWPVVILLFRK